MIDYLQGALAGREGIEVTMRLNAEKAGTFATTLTTVDTIGVVTHRDGITAAYPWSAVRKIEIRDDAL